MKRLIVILSIAVGIVLIVGLLVWMKLPSAVTFLLGRAIGGRIEARQSTVSWNGGIAVIELNDATLSGDIQGTIKKTRLDLRIGRGIYIKYALVSDFDVVIKKEKPSVRFLPLQLEYAEIVKGRAIYKGQTVTINSIKVSNFNTAGQFQFSLDGAIEGFGKIKTHGGGTWRDGRSDINGTYQIADFDLGRLFRDYEGRGYSKGELTYRNGELGLHGVAGAVRFVMRESFLKKPIEVPRVDCTIDIETSKGKVETELGGLSFEGTSLHISFTTIGERLETLELVSGPLDIRNIQDYLTLSFVKRLPAVMDAVSSGKVTVRELKYVGTGRFTAHLFLQDVEAHYKEVRFVGITGDLQLDKDKLVVADLKARSGNSIFSGVSGSVPFSEKGEIRISGRYQLDLADAARFIPNGDLRMSFGSAEGIAEIRGKKEQDMRIEGTGSLKGAVLSWRNLRFMTSGSYAFDNNSISCSPFFVKRDATELQVRGRVARDSTDLKIKGQIDAADAGRLCLFPYPLAGSAGVDGRVEGKNGNLAWRGAVSMDALSFDIPGFMRKKVGVPSLATFRVRTGNGDLYIEDLNYVISTITLHVMGKAGWNRVSNLRLRVDAPNLDQDSDLFLANGRETKGEVRADLQVYDLQYPLVRLPRMEGYVTVKNGYLVLPFFPKPLDKMDAVCHFMGEHYELKVASLRAGTSAIETATLVVEGTERPRVSLVVNAVNFNTQDIIHEGGEPWRIRTMRPDSPLSKMSGDIALQARHVQWDRVGLDGFHAKLRLAYGKLLLDDAGAGVFGGAAHADGSADFSGHRPHYRLTGGIDRIAWGEMFKTINGEAEVMKGSGMVQVNLESEGENAREIAQGMSGHITANSTDGVIHRWNLLSKMFGLLNFYDLLQGKVNLAKEGLPYRIMSADFTGKNGLFRTRNFLIDSPSMYISGQGAVTLPDRTVEGQISISPLVTVDTILNKIPIIRRILREKKEGFFFVVYNIAGPLSDPDIHSTYFKSLGMRAYMVLRNLISLPKEGLKQ